MNFKYEQDVESIYKSTTPGKVHEAMALLFDWCDANEHNPTRNLVPLREEIMHLHPYVQQDVNHTESDHA